MRRPRAHSDAAPSTCPAPTASCSTARTCRSPSWSATRTASAPDSPADTVCSCAATPPACSPPSCCACQPAPRSATSSTTPARPPRRRSLGRPAPARCAQLVQDLHPHDRGPGRAPGSVIANGSLSARRPPHAARLAPLPPAATAGRPPSTTSKPPSLARYKLGRPRRRRHGSTGPAARRARQDPLPAPPGLDAAQPDRPGILTPPGHPPACCAQRTITVPPQVAAKTRQNTYPSAASRQPSAARQRRTSNATIKDPPRRHRPRLVQARGLTPVALSIACLLAIRDQRIAAAFAGPPGRQRPPRRRRLPPRARKRRRTTLARPCRRAAGGQRQQAPARHGDPPIDADARRPAPRCPRSCASGKPGPAAVAMITETPASRGSRTQMVTSVPGEV